MNMAEPIPGVFLLRERAIWIPEISAVVVADIHLGYESGLFDEPFYPRMQFRDVAERMERLIERYSPETVIIDGDLKHEFSSMPYGEFRDVGDFLDILEGRRVLLVRGNHDNFIVGYLKKRGVEVADEMELGRFFFVHGHRGAKIPENRLVIMGHEHPVVRIRDEVGGRALFPCFFVTERLILLPAFSEISGGTDFLERRSFLSPILSSGRIKTDGGRIFAISGEGIIEIPAGEGAEIG